MRPTIKKETSDGTPSKEQYEKALSNCIRRQHRIIERLAGTGGLVGPLSKEYCFLDATVSMIREELVSMDKTARF